MERKVIQVAKVATTGSQRGGALDNLATLCFYYPQYTLAAARKLPAPHVTRLLKKANQIESNRFYNLTNIAAAPHTKGGKLVGELLKAFKEAAHG